jgi:predicted SprT family Zn-dependent metalloprotease
MDGEWVWAQAVLAWVSALGYLSLFPVLRDALLPWRCEDCGKRVGQRRRVLTPAGRLWVCGPCRRFWKGLP